MKTLMTVCLMLVFVIGFKLRKGDLVRYKNEACIVQSECETLESSGWLLGPNGDRYIYGAKDQMDLRKRVERK